MPRSIPPASTGSHRASRSGASTSSSPPSDARALDGCWTHSPPASARCPARSSDGGDDDVDAPDRLALWLPVDAGGMLRGTVSYTHLRAHETDSYLVCRRLLENK